MSRALSSSSSPRCLDLRSTKYSLAAPICRASRFRTDLPPGKIQVASTVDRRCLASAPPESFSIVNVDLGDRSYPIYIGSGLLDNSDLIRKHVPGRTALVVTNETIAPLYLERTVAALESSEELPRQKSSYYLMANSTKTSMFL